MRKKQIWQRIAAVALALLLWQGCASALHSQILLVPPWKVAVRLAGLVREPDFYRTVLFSLSRISLGFLLGFSAGALLAVLASRFPVAETLLWPYITLVKTTPVASFIILCLIWLNSSSLPVFISFLMVLPIVYSNLLQGIRAADKDLLQMAKLFRIGGWRQFTCIYLPQLEPYLTAACSVSLGLAWKAGIAAEVIGIPDGSIGEMLYDAKVYLNSADLFAWTFVIIAVSVLFEKLLMKLLKAFYRHLYTLKPKGGAAWTSP